MYFLSDKNDSCCYAELPCLLDISLMSIITTLSYYSTACQKEVVYLQIYFCLYAWLFFTLEGIIQINTYLEESDLKAKFKMAIIGVLCLITVFLAAFVIVDFGQAEERGEAVSAMAESSEICYVLRDYEGYVAIFVENDPTCPMTVTDIQVSTLRELDKMLLETGMKLYSRERLMMTLEDLGS